jgi:hypothetical protein
MCHHLPCYQPLQIANAGFSSEVRQETPSATTIEPKCQYNIHIYFLKE